MSNSAAAEKVDNPTTKRTAKPGLIDVSKSQEIEALGYKVDAVNGVFMASQIDGEEVIGPAANVAALHTLVKQKVGNKFPLPKEETEAAPEGETDDPEKVGLSEDSKGRTYLPGSGPIVDKVIAKIAQDYENVKMERVALSNREKVLKADLIAQCHLKPELFTPDPKDTTSKIYVVADIEIRIANEVTEKVTTKRIEEEE